jgi:hypothetical protein
MLEAEPSFRRLVDHDGHPRLEDLDDVVAAVDQLNGGS